jgi:hypothetical protein
MSPLDVLAGIVLLSGLGYIGFYIYAVVKGVMNIIKETKVLAPKPLSDCGPGKQSDAGLCYDACKPGYKGLGPLCNVDVHGVGVGTPVELEDCPSGWNNDGITCREPMGWNDRCVNWGLYWTGCAKGGAVKGRLDGGGKCSGGREKVDGLCYNKCPDGMEHVPGMPFNCRVKGVTLPYGRGVGGIPGCPKGQVKSGLLCYDDPGPGWTVVAGIASKDCPAGSKDGGLFCIPGQGDLPWYLTIYMLMGAVAAVAGALIYFRVRSIRKASEVSGGGRTRKTKSRK